MNTIETIQEKVYNLPVKAQEEVLEAIEQIEKRYKKNGTSGEQNGDVAHPLDLLAEIQLKDAPEDLAERHDFYAHGKLED